MSLLHLFFYLQINIVACYFCVCLWCVCLMLDAIRLPDRLLLLDAIHSIFRFCKWISSIVSFFFVFCSSCSTVDARSMITTGKNYDRRCNEETRAFARNKSNLQTTNDKLRTNRMNREKTEKSSRCHLKCPDRSGRQRDTSKEKWNQNTYRYIQSTWIKKSAVRT